MILFLDTAAAPWLMGILGITYLLKLFPAVFLAAICVIWLCLPVIHAQQNTITLIDPSVRYFFPWEKKVLLPLIQVGQLSVAGGKMVT